MPSSRRFWLRIRIAFAAGAMMFGLLMYILHLKSVISLRITLPLAILFTIIAGILLNNAEKKHKYTPQSDNQIS
jgi:hypothetical protein